MIQDYIYSAVTMLSLFYPWIILFFSIYLIRKAYKTLKLYVKIVCAITVLSLYNLPPGKSILMAFTRPQECIYDFQTCDGSFTERNWQYEWEWRDKTQIDVLFDSWKSSNPSKNQDILYRTFEFKWWKFWEYGTYLTTDVYKYPILPTNCVQK